jgi:hypothetical protein
MKNQSKYLQTLFYEILNDYGKVYLAVRHSEDTMIGVRGFTDEEKKKGLVLVFTQKNCRDLMWSDDGSIRVTLGFGAGNKPGKCFIHADDVVSVFSPDAKVKLDRWDIWDQQDAAMKSDAVPRATSTESRDDKVVSLDRFRKSKD